MSRSFKTEFLVTSSLNYIESAWCHVTQPKDVARFKHKIRTAGYSGINALPKQFRKGVNKQRRLRDKHEVHNSVRKENYTPNMSTWNCKDSNSWGWW